MNAEKYTLTKEGKGDVHTSSEAVKHRHLADGYELTVNAQQGDAADSTGTAITVDTGGLSGDQIAAAADEVIAKIADVPKPGQPKPSNKPTANR